MTNTTSSSTSPPLTTSTSTPITTSNPESVMSLASSPSPLLPTSSISVTTSPTPTTITASSPTLTSTSTAINSSPTPNGSGSTSNRFGLALNFIQRRPRGLSSSTNGKPSSPGSGSSSNGITSGGGNFFGAAGIISSGSNSNNNSPSSEIPPSPNNTSTERERSYGFPALRRQLSKKPGNGSTSPPSHATTSPDLSGNSASGSGIRTRSNRSSSQPPEVPIGLTDRLVINTNSRPHTAGASTPTSNTTVPTSPSTTNTTQHRLRLVPHLESARSLHFDPLDRDLPSFFVLRVGRFTDRSTSSTTTSDPRRIAFKSKVVSRGHAEIWCDNDGKFFIKDTKSSSGTFLNHIRLSGPGSESRPFPLKDGDILQLGVDYQGGTEEIYRCVKMKVELNRGWQRGMNSFNTNALAQLRALGGGSAVASDATETTTSKVKTVAAQKAAHANSVTDCCICLFPVTVCQALFIAPCSHVTHFKCIRPLVDANYPGFSCPLCRTYADLEADVEIEPWEMEPVPVEVEKEKEEEKEEESEVLETLDESALVASTGATSSSRPASVKNTTATVGVDESESAEPSTSSTSIHRTSITPSTELITPSTILSSTSFSSLPEPITMGSESSSFKTETQAALLLTSANNTFNAEDSTPKNSTFLSTLADSVPVSDLVHHSHSHAITGSSAASSTSNSKIRKTPLTSVVSSSSEDEVETDGTSSQKEDDSSSSSIKLVKPSNEVEVNGKGKGKWVPGSEIPMEDLEGSSTSG